MALDFLLYAVIAVIVILAIVLVVLFNSLIVSRNRVKNAWSQIDVQLKKRNDLVPNLVETVKGYTKHEKAIFSQITQARTAITNAKRVAEKAKASNILTSALKSLFALAESNPQLQASANFLQLQEELSGIEAKIAYARQFYNDSVLAFNNNIQTFPGNIVAGLFSFKQQEFFEILEGEKAVPKVSF